MEPAVTGEDCLHTLLRSLQKMPLTDPVIRDIQAQLTAIKDLLYQLDRQTSTAARMLIYEALITAVESFNIPVDKGKLFQVDMFHQQANASLPIDWQEQLSEAISFLSGLKPYQPNKNLASFCSNFTARYDSQWLPLNQVLDADSGIGYTNEINHSYAPLLEGLEFASGKPETPAFNWNPRESWLLQQLLSTNQAATGELRLTAKDLLAFPANWDNLPTSMSVVFSETAAGQLFIEGVNAGATNLLGRFAAGSPGIEGICLDIANAEQSQNPEVIFAEIVHLPENRTGNIMLRPVLRAFEIPYLATPGVAPQEQIGLEDLWVTVRQGKVQLFSRRLRKRIIPRLSTAHNFSLSSLPVYRFLCDLQHQGQRTQLGFKWGLLSQECDFLPRVVYKNVILFAARWKLRKQQFESVFELAEADQMKWMQQFIQQEHLPPVLLLVDGDNTLPVNSEDPLSVAVFLASIKNREQVILQECFIPAAASETGHTGFCRQYIAPIIQTKAVYTAIQDNLPAVNELTSFKLRRSFPPGSEWCYLKLFCSEAASTSILTEHVLPLVQKLQEAAIIDQWFFIRYHEQGHHLRLRFQAGKAAQINPLTSAVQQLAASLVDGGLVHKVEQTTYEREVERYSPGLILLAENFFHFNSEAILHFLSTDPAPEQTLAWGIFYIDQLLHQLGLSLLEKSAWSQRLEKAFALEFKPGPQLRNGLNAKYERMKRQLKLALENQAVGESESASDICPTFPTNWLTPVQAVLRQPAPDAAGHSFVAGIIHMHINRLFQSNQRQHEYMIHCFMHRYYHSTIEREKQQSKI